jgi:hypothetical protein
MPFLLEKFGLAREVRAHPGAAIIVEFSLEVSTALAVGCFLAARVRDEKLLELPFRTR